jgi:hypothetical protein
MQNLIQKYQGGQSPPGAHQLLQQAFGEQPIGDRPMKRREDRKVWDNVCSPFRGLWIGRN